MKSAPCLGFALAVAASTTACYRSAPDDPPDAAALVRDSGLADHVADTPRADDAARVDAPVSFAPAYTYVVMQLNVDTTDSPERTHRGFDLDGLASVATDADGCLYADSLGGGDVANIPEGCSYSDPGCRGRVDNQFWSFVPTLNAASPLIEVGDWRPAPVELYQQVLMVRLLGIDDFTNDDSVTALLYRAYPAFTTGCDDGRGVIDREFVIARSSLVPGATSIDQARVVISASIVDRRIRVHGSAEDAVDFSIGDALGIRFTAPLYAITMRWDFYMPDDVYGYNGHFGGWMTGEDLVDGVSASFPAERGLIESAIAGLADIRLDGVCDDTTSGARRIGGVSMGGGIRMVRARVRAVGPVVDSHPPDACGYTGS